MIVLPVLRIVQDMGIGKSDTVLSMRKTGCFDAHIERKSGYLVAFRIDDRQDNAFNHATIKAFSSILQKLKKNFTVDNEKEFAAHKALVQVTGMKVFFCDPYSPWQRSTNENTNGLLCQFFPKDASFANVSDDDLQRVVDLINNRPHKHLNFLTFFEMIQKFFSDCVALDLTIYLSKNCGSAYLPINIIPSPFL